MKIYDKDISTSVGFFIASPSQQIIAYAIEKHFSFFTTNITNPQLQHTQ